MLKHYFQRNGRRSCSATSCEPGGALRLAVGTAGDDGLHEPSSEYRGAPTHTGQRRSRRRQIIGEATIEEFRK